jgi:hypothetical protein
MFRTANYVCLLQYKHNIWINVSLYATPQNQARTEREAASTPSVDNLRSLPLKRLQELNEQGFCEHVKNVFETGIGMVM